MKRTILAALLISTAGAASALTFDYQAQFASEELIHGYDANGMTFAPVTASQVPSSLETLYLEANVDGIAPNDFSGVIVETGPTEISLYEVFRDSPEGVAYADYHERFPVGTDWAQVQLDHQARQMENLASDAPIDGSGS